MLPQIEPVLPKLVKDAPRGRAWVYEVKLDGFRGTLHVEAGRGRFLSKTKKWMVLEGAVAKRRGDPYSQETEWLRSKHPTDSQKEGRAELSHRRRT